MPLTLSHTRTQTHPLSYSTRTIQAHCKLTIVLLIESVKTQFSVSCMIQVIHSHGLLQLLPTHVLLFVSVRIVVVMDQAVLLVSTLCYVFVCMYVHVCMCVYVMCMYMCVLLQPLAVVTWGCVYSMEWVHPVEIKEWLMLKKLKLDKDFQTATYNHSE